jgi:hypothetical protein
VAQKSSKPVPIAILRKRRIVLVMLPISVLRRYVEPFSIINRFSMRALQ